MNNNSLGKIFSVTSFGESHGPMVGCVVQGVPAGMQIDVPAMQAMVDLRKTNTTNFASARKEEDVIEIVSGVFEGKSLGSPICILIKNKDAQSADYEALKDVYRPNHADYTTQQKYGIRDARGGGRSSIRVTAPLVAAGALALQLLQQYSTIEINSFVYQIGTISMADIEKHVLQNATQIYNNPLRCPSIETANKMQELIDNAKVNGDTLGGCICTQITNMPVGIGEPLFAKLQSALAQAMLSINTVKGFEYGDGFTAAAQTGGEHNDSFATNNEDVITTTNHSGGIQGGISNGMPITFNCAFKPISSIAKLQHTINEKGNNIAVEIKGRHDVCAVPRAVPIVNAYTAIVLADFFLQQKINKI